MVPPLLDVQEYCTPEVEEEPFSVTEDVEQFKIALLPALTFGVAEVFVTVTLLVAEHPPVCVVTVKVYVPAALTVGVAVFPLAEIKPPFEAAQEKLTFGVDDDPFN